MDKQSCCPQPANLMMFYFGGLFGVFQTAKKKANVLKKKIETEKGCKLIYCETSQS